MSWRRVLKAIKHFFGKETYFDSQDCENHLREEHEKWEKDNFIHSPGSSDHWVEMCKGTVPLELFDKAPATELKIWEDVVWPRPALDLDGEWLIYSGIVDVCSIIATLKNTELPDALAVELTKNINEYSKQEHTLETAIQRLLEDWDTNHNLVYKFFADRPSLALQIKKTNNDTFAQDLDKFLTNHSYRLSSDLRRNLKEMLKANSQYPSNCSIDHFTEQLNKQLRVYRGDA